MPSRIPKVPYAAKMRSKSSTRVLSVLEKDPSKSEDMNCVLQSFLKYLPAVTECGNVRAKTLVQGQVQDVEGL